MFGERKFYYKSLMVLLILAIMCSFGISDLNAQTKKIRFAYSSIPDFGDLPSLIAWKSLPQLGYEVEIRQFARTDLAVNAVLTGDADISAAAAIGVIKAIEAGADLRIIADQVKNEWQLLTPVSIKDPKQLNGKKVAFHGPFTVTDGLVKWMAKKYDIKPEWMIIPGSEVRAEALMKGQIDATPAEIGDVINVLKKKPGQFHVLISYARVFPELMGTSYFTKRDFIQKNPGAIQAVLEAILKVHRQASASIKFMADEAPKLLPGSDQETNLEIAKVYDELKIWDVNGGLTFKKGEETLKFYVDTGLVKKKLTFADCFDVKPLEAALTKIGRQ